MKYNFFDLFVNIKDRNEYLEKIHKAVINNEKKVFFYLNSHSFFCCSKDETFKNTFLKADYIIADGYGIVWGLKFLYKQRVEKVVFTHSFVDKFGNDFSEKRLSIYMLGGNKLVITNAVSKIQEKFEGINLAGFSYGYFNSKEEEKIINDINILKPDILIVGMGLPRSEIWINNNLPKLDTHCIISVGGFFDYMAGKIKFAPKWMHNSGLEWIYRLLQEPKRLSKRYFITQPFFLKKVIKEYLRTR